VASLLSPRLTPPVAPVRERRTVTAQAGDAFSPGMPMPSAESKTMRLQSALRDHGLNARSMLSISERETAAEKIADIVTHSSWFQRSKFVACYLSVNSEVDTWSIIARAWAMKKRIFAPVIEKTSQMTFRELSAESSLERDQYGIFAPRDGEFIDPRKLDIVLTPLVAFDAENNRIGMGGGYFDRTFSFLKYRKSHFHPKLIGLGYACQKVDHIPPNRWDIRLYDVISESQ
jgi:5-formyltetrahydrofolate cyclo-ligase